MVYKFLLDSSVAIYFFSSLLHLAEGSQTSSIQFSSSYASGFTVLIICFWLHSRFKLQLGTTEFPSMPWLVFESWQELCCLHSNGWVIVTRRDSSTECAYNLAGPLWLSYKHLIHSNFNCIKSYFFWFRPMQKSSITCLSSSDNKCHCEIQKSGKIIQVSGVTHLMQVAYSHMQIDKYLMCNQIAILMSRLT